MEGYSNNKVYEIMGMMGWAFEENSEIVEWERRNTLMWYRHIERMDEGRLF